MRGNGAFLVVPKMIKRLIMSRIDVIDIGNPRVSAADNIIKEFGNPFAVSCHEDMRESIPSVSYTHLTLPTRIRV